MRSTGDDHDNRTVSWAPATASSRIWGCRFHFRFSPIRVSITDIAALRICAKNGNRACKETPASHLSLGIHKGPRVNCLVAHTVRDSRGTLSAYTKPLGSYVSLKLPFSCLPRVSIKRVPKRCLIGART